MPADPRPVTQPAISGNTSVTQPTTTESPIVGSSSAGAAVTGTAVGNIGVSGTSVNRSPAPGTQFEAGVDLNDDGVYGKGKNGVHGVCSGIVASDSGVLGENSTAGPGVTGTSAKSDGVLGVGANGVHGKTTSASGSGVLGENSGIGTGVTGTSQAGNGITGTGGLCGVTGITTAIVNGVAFAGVCGQSSGPGAGVYAESNGPGPAIAAVAQGNQSQLIGAASANSGLAGLFVGKVLLTGALSGTTATFTDALSGTTAKFTGELSGTTADFTGAVKGSSAIFSGAIQASDVMLSGADCAEEFDVAPAKTLEPGTVVVFNADAALTECSEAYSKCVAGVISGGGNYRPGVILDRRAASEGRAAIALAGKVFCKVDATYSSIEVGDLLTTSESPGCAMKAVDRSRALGAVIGKALRGHACGRGLIPILVMLQ